MDALDLKIVGVLDVDALQSFANVAHSLRIPPRTVQRRVTSMVRGGFIRSFEVLLDRSLLGFGEALCDVFVRNDVPVEAVRRRLLEVPGLTRILTLVGGTLVAYLNYSMAVDLEQKLSTIARTSGVSDIHYELSPQIEASDHSLSRNDWRIIRALNHNARRELSSVAEDLGVSSRTIARRVRILAQESALRFGVDVDISKAEDLFLYLLVLRLKQGFPRRTIVEEIRQSIPRAWREMGAVNPFTLTLCLYAQKLADLERDVETARLASGVASTSVAFVTAEHNNYRWLDQVIRQNAT